MRRIEKSGGLEWRSANDNCFIDAFALDLSAITVDEVETAATKMMWQPLTRGEIANPVLAANYVGWHGVSMDKPRITLRLLVRKNHDILTALYDIERDELGELRPGMIGAILAATKFSVAQQNDARNFLPSMIANLCTRRQMGSHALDRMSKAVISNGAIDHIRAVCNGEPGSEPAGMVNRARFWMEIAHQLWQPTALKLCSAAPPERIEEFAMLAAATTLIEGMTAVTLPGGAQFKLQRLTYHSAWVEALKWTSHAIPPGAATMFNGYVATDESYLAARKLVIGTTDQQNQVYTRLIDEAKTNQAYQASGSFLLELPEFLPLGEIKSLAIYAAPDRLWLAGITTKNERTISDVWSPLDPPGDLLDLVLAAFWHDLLVAGETVVVAANNHPPRPKSTPKQTGKKASKPAVLNLPRASVHITGRRKWGSEADQAEAKQTRIFLGGFRRTLPDGWKRGAEIQAYLDQSGIILPDSYTFVRPASDRPLAPTRPVRARGLATLAAIL